MNEKDYFDLKMKFGRKNSKKSFKDFESEKRSNFFFA